jgi:hypothetical protein
MSDKPPTPAPHLNQPPVGIINPKKILPKTTLKILSFLPTFFLKSIGVTSQKKLMYPGAMVFPAYPCSPALTFSQTASIFEERAPSASNSMTVIFATIAFVIIGL